MDLRRTTRSAVVVLVPVATVVALLLAPPPVQLAVAGLIGAAVAVWIGLRHPLGYYWALAFALGALPFGDVLLTPLPMVPLFSAAAVLAALIHPTAVARTTPLEVAVWLVVLTSTLSVVVTGRTAADYAEYAKWLVATLVVVALLRLDRAYLARFGRIFVASSAGAAVFALVVRFLDPQSRLIGLLAPVGYQDPIGSRYVYYDEGARTLRLGGTWLDPNAAGIFLLVALALCVLLFRGRLRVLLGALLLVAIVLTLSRAAMFTVVGAVLLMLVLQHLPNRFRAAVAGAIGAGAVLAFALPTVRERLLNSFSSSDVGSSARLEALQDFPGTMTGSWLFGRGWGLPEFLDPATAFLTNYPANAPIVSVYRGGLFVGVAFVAVLVIGTVMGYQLMRTPSWEAGALGAGFIAFCVVALQLDFPVVTIPPVITVFSVLLAFLAAAWEEHRAVSPDDAAPAAPRPRGEPAGASARR